MFDEKVKVLKSKYDLICEELRNIINEYNKNLKNQSKIKKLRACRHNLKSIKTILIGMPFACLVGVIIGCLMVFSLNPAAFMTFLSDILLTSLVVSSSIIIFIGINYFKAKNKYKKIATAENLAMERNFDEIVSSGVSLEKKLKLFKEKANMYENIISYFRNYSSKVNLLNSIIEEKNNNLENSCSKNNLYSDISLNTFINPKNKCLTNRIK